MWSTWTSQLQMGLSRQMMTIWWWQCQPYDDDDAMMATTRSHDDDQCWTVEAESQDFFAGGGEYHWGAQHLVDTSLKKYLGEKKIVEKSTFWSNLTAGHSIWHSEVVWWRSRLTLHDHQTVKNAFMSILCPCLFCTNLSPLSLLSLWFEIWYSEIYFAQLVSCLVLTTKKDLGPTREGGIC